jgi:hypothetical protein
MKKLTGTEGNNSIWRKQAAMGHPWIPCRCCNTAIVWADLKLLPTLPKEAKFLQQSWTLMQLRRTSTSWTTSKKPQVCEGKLVFNGNGRVLPNRFEVPSLASVCQHMMGFEIVSSTEDREYPFEISEDLQQFPSCCSTWSRI